MIVEGAIQVHQNLLRFIDYKKAFDRMDHSKLTELSDLINTAEKDMRIIKILYYEQTAAVRVGNELTEWTKIGTGFRQGYVLSPDLYNLYCKIIFRNIQYLDGIIIGGTNINNIRYADDTVLLATSENKLQELIDQVVFHSKNYGMEVNTTEAECMVKTKSQSIPMCKIKIDGTTQWRNSGATRSSISGGNFHELSFDDVIVFIQPSQTVTDKILFATFPKITTFQF